MSLVVTCLVKQAHYIIVWKCVQAQIWDHDESYLVCVKTSNAVGDNPLIT